ncbi:hypothetical protein NGRA_2007 [Nosema granulosis]|uniref:MULE transposase domain-containing protein n=1 Tax=Nosema granulosis TaxID=83296 RepID=A0A9P6KYK0_9MICR|nr:hypothetical protein NGRA_2007 [Nosema granulosis]
MDVTFKSAPNEFYQLYIIHGEFNSQYFPLVYCFLKDKTEDTYDHLFTKIKEVFQEKDLGFPLPLFKIDFEYAAFNAINSSFPSAIRKGCFFHFAQAIWRKVVDLGLKPMYNNDRNFRESIGMITALAIILSAKIDEAWDLIKNTLSNTSRQIIDIFAYIEDVWLSDNRSLFAREIWSQNGVSRGRTNNYAEGVHSAINSSVNKSRPNFFEIKKILTELHISNVLEFLRLIGGGDLKERKKKTMWNKTKKNNQPH